MNSRHQENKTKFSTIRLSSTVIIVVALFAVAAVSAGAQTVTTLANFTSGTTSSLPTLPQGPMAQGRDGNFYGISASGSGCCQGVFYKVSSSGVITALTALT